MGNVQCDSQNVKLSMGVSTGRQQENFRDRLSPTQKTSSRSTSLTQHVQVLATKETVAFIAVQRPKVLDQNVVERPPNRNVLSCS